MFYVYGLRLANDSEYRYVGSTYDLDARLYQHYQFDGGNPEKDRWLAENYGQIELDVLAEVDEVERRKAEQEWIVMLRQDGHRLFNIRRAHRNTFADLPDEEKTAAIARFLDQFEGESGTPWAQ